MILDEEIAKIANLIGDKTRSSMLIALMEGKALTASELAFRANISPQTASNHLKKLIDTKLIFLIKTPTRYRYFKIASPLVAKALESLSLLIDIEKKKPPRHDKLDKDICFARTCYDHLAGKLGVEIAYALQKKNYLKMDDDQFSLTEEGGLFFKEIEINCDELIKLRRQFAKPCLDWTEREYHLAGCLGHVILDFFIKNRLLIKSKDKPRVMLLTEKGRTWLKKYLDVE